MAETDRRERVGDPLALNPNAQAADRSLSLTMVRNPGQTGGDSVFRDQMNVVAGIEELSRTVGAVVESKKEDWQTEGKMLYMQGATEQAIQATGNKYTMQGWQSLNAADAANRWYAEEVSALENGSQQMSPDAYNKLLMDKRSQFFNDLPDDPAVRKVWVAAFDDLGTRLAGAQVAAHNAYNTQQYENNFSSMLQSGSYANADASTVIPGNSPLRLSPGVVRPTVSNYSDRDIDILTRTMLGEAAGEGSTGLAAVAHVLVNRALDGGYGGNTLESVALAPKQFSAWNKGAGGNNPSKWDPNGQTYQQARSIAIDVLSGHHTDPTNGATHYYSPKGMEALVAQGAQSNLVPRWLDAERAKSGGVVTIGGHIFVGRGKNSVQVAEAGATNDSGGSLPAPASVQLEVDPDTDPTVVAQAAGVPTVGTPSPAQTQVQELIRNANMPPDRKAAILGNQMINQLMMGDDQLFTDAGGLGMLEELNADPALIRQVYSASESFKTKKQNEFNLERVQTQNTRVEQVRNGQVPLDAALAAIQSEYDSDDIDATKATQLVNQVMAADEALRSAGNSDPALRRGLTTIYRGVQVGDYTAEEAQELAQEMADEYDMPRAQIESWIGDMWNAEQSNFTRDQTAVRQAQADFEKDEAAKKQVDYFLSAGAGAGTLTGNLSDGTPVKQYAVNQIRERAAAAANEALAGYSESMTPAEAQAKAASVGYEMFHTSLMQQDLVDTQLQSAFTGASRGAVVTDGKVNPGTLAAFDDYMQMLTNPSIGGAYASQYLQHEDGRDLFTLASQLYASDNDIERALLAAHDYLRGGQGRSAADVTISSVELDKELNTNIGKYFNDFMNVSSMPEGDAMYARGNMGDWSNIVKARATAYALDKPFVPSSVHIQKAAEDVAKDTFLVGGNFVYTDTRQNPDGGLLNVMGLSGRGTDAPNAAIDLYLNEFMQPLADKWKADGTDSNGWGRAWAEREQDLGQVGMSWSGMRPGSAALAGQNLPARTPPYYAQYDPSTQNFYVYLWSDDTRSSLAAYDNVDVPTIVIPAKEAGALYTSKKPAAMGPLDATTNFFVDMIEGMGRK